MVGVVEVDAKVKYTQLARSLKTYGITFFLVKVGIILILYPCECDFYWLDSVAVSLSLQT